jgi:hypothetical protein
VIVRLTTRQWYAVMCHLGDSWLYEWAKGEGRITDEGKKVEVLMLPDAWRAIADELVDRYFTTGSIRKVSAPLFDGVRRIVKQTNARQEHPAFAGVALEGRQFEVLPAWEWLPSRDTAEGERNPRTHWSPWIPSCDEIPDYGLCSLWPEHHRKGGVVFTEWHHSTMRTTGPISTDAYDRFIKARPAAAGSPK